MHITPIIGTIFFLSDASRQISVGTNRRQKKITQNGRTFESPNAKNGWADGRTK